MNIARGLTPIVWGILFTVAASLVLALFAWLFRYEQLTPIYPDISNPLPGLRGKLVIICRVDRWTSQVSCGRIIIDEEAELRASDERLKNLNQKYELIPEKWAPSPKQPNSSYKSN